ncbi:RDD family protein [Kribbella sp. NPDC026611]|uniref:RDD family protein n=1 Tax=Kribbella sp. NPDC026611 TaxID=3154911 RepID=UPI0033F4D161
MSNPAGWYDDPQDPSQQRYWDGSTWMEQRRPQQGPAPAQHGQVYGGGAGQFPQYGQEPPQQEEPPQYGQRIPQYGQQAPQYGQQAPQYGQQAPQYGQQYGQPQYGQYGPHQQQPGYPGPGYGYPGKAVHTTPDGQLLSGWWRRVWARVIDGLLAGLIALPLTGYFYYRYFQVVLDYFNDTVDASSSGTPPTSFGLPSEAYQWMIPIVALGLLVSFAYEYLFLTKKGATPGKMALGIAVRLRDRPGNPPGVAVLKRYGLYMGISLLAVIPVVGTLFSFLGLINDLWPLWDDKKQALHDKVAETNVVRT